MTGDIALEALAMTEPTRLQMLEDDHMEADREFRKTHADWLLGEATDSDMVMATQRAWLAKDTLEVERAAAKDDEALPF